MYRFILFYSLLYVCIDVAPWSCEARHFVPLYVHTCSGMTIKLNLTWLEYAIKMTQFTMDKNLPISWCWQGNNNQVTLVSPFLFHSSKNELTKWSLDLHWETVWRLTGANWIDYTKGLVQERGRKQNRSAHKTLSSPFCYSDKIVEKAACSPNPPNFWINCHLIAVES